MVSADWLTGSLQEPTSLRNTGKSYGRTGNVVELYLLYDSNKIGYRPPTEEIVLFLSVS